MISPSNEKFLYSGRIDFDNPQRPIFTFPSSYVHFRFKGKYLKIFVRNLPRYYINEIGYILDGKEGKIRVSKGEESFDIPIDNEGIHKCILFKRQDLSHEFEFLGIDIGQGNDLLKIETSPTLNLEFYGDSLCAGEVSEAKDYVGKEDPIHEGEYSNSYYSFAWMTARKLEANLHNIAQGGIALLDHTGWYQEPYLYGMETFWNKCRFNPLKKSEWKDWDFSLYTPDVVVVAIGQNDARFGDYMSLDYEGDEAYVWRRRYREWLCQLRGIYPKAIIICCMTIMIHSAGWDQGIKSVVQSLDDSRIRYYAFKRNGRATPGHLRKEEANEMAVELSQYIRALILDR